MLEQEGNVAMGDQQSNVGADLSEHMDRQRVLKPGSAGFEDAIRLWNGAVAHRPAVVVQPKWTSEVQSIVRYVHDNDIAVSVCGGGHDWAGRALVPAGVVIDMSLMRFASVDVAAKVATFGGGATASDVATAAGPHGLAPVTGQFGAVGMVGLTLAGGYGPLLGVAGLALDNVVELQIVLADGRAVIASADREPDLFWAARGGGGNFGVVTQMRVRLRRVPSVIAGVIGFPWHQAGDVLRGYATLIGSLPDELTVSISAATGPDGNLALFLWPTWSGPAEASSPWLTRLSELGRPILTHIAPMPYSAALRLLDPYIVSGRHYEMRTRNLSTFTPEAIDALVHAGVARTSNFSGFSIHHFRGAATRVPVEQTAFGIREPHFLVEVLAAWNPAEDGAAQHRDWAEASYEALKAHSLDGGYPNLIGPEQQAQADWSYGPNADRLRILKRRFDPSSVFAATPLPSPGGATIFW
ncbi:MAG: FAD-binding oxidoreductase [Actinomycetota bacterium]|nr:FAD-binding oxidoreductase [Actinomycetota bacterium]